MDTPPPPPLTLGESLANVSRGILGAKALLFQLVLPVGFTWFMVDTYRSGFFSSVPWRLPLLLSWSAYVSLFFMMTSYAELFLPRTPLAVFKKIKHITGPGVFIFVILVTAVLGSEVKDTRVLVGCTCVIAAFIAGLVALWVWLARTYGGDPSENLPAAV